jgi:hypothetical protein
MSRFLAAVLLLIAGTVFWFLTRDEDVSRAGSMRLVKVADFESPTFLTSPQDDDRQFVTERAGRIRVVRDGRVLE